MKDQRDILFKETQRFTQWWLWIFLIGMLTLPIYGMVQQFILGEPWGEQTNARLGPFALWVGNVSLCIFLLRYTTQNLDPSGRYCCFFSTLFQKEALFRFRHFISQGHYLWFHRIWVAV